MTDVLRTDKNIAAPIECIVSDVDGVLTDGGITYSESGDEIKRFHVRDGVAVKAWMRSGHEFALLTARQSQLVQRRGEELGIKHILQGRGDKWPAAEMLLESLSLQPAQVCYIGDDLPDIPVMRRVGLAVAPADAAGDARDVATWILRSRGGEGVIRELVERLLKAKQQWKDQVPE